MVLSASCILWFIYLFIFFFRLGSDIKIYLCKVCSQISVRVDGGRGEERAFVRVRAGARACVVSCLGRVSAVIGVGKWERAGLRAAVVSLCLSVRRPTSRSSFSSRCLLVDPRWNRAPDVAPWHICFYNSVSVSCCVCISVRIPVFGLRPKMMWIKLTSKLAALLCLLGLSLAKGYLYQLIHVCVHQTELHRIKN